MIKNYHKILAAVLIVQIVLSVVVFWPRPSTAGQRDPMFPDLETEDVTILAIEDAEGKAIELERVADDWVLPEAAQYPAKGEAVQAFLDKLLALTTGRLVTSSTTSHKRLQVAADDFARRVTFETPEGRRETIYVGSSPRYGSVHFRVEGQSETYLTSELTTWDVNPTFSTWADASYQSVPRESITRMTLENGNGTFVFEKDDIDTWSAVELPTPEEAESTSEEGKTLDQAQVRTVLGRAASVTMKKPLGKEEREAYGMDEPNAIVTLETADQTVTLYVGAEDADDGSYVVKSSESDYFVQAATASVAALVDSGRDDFFQESTPQPESNGS
jgi:hypothetical protein